MLTGVRTVFCGAIARPGVVETGCTAAGALEAGADCCPLAAAPIRSEAQSIQAQRRVISVPRFLKKLSVELRSQLERDRHGPCEIYRRSISLRRLVLNLIGCSNCGLIQTVSQPANDTIHMQLTIGSEHDLQEHLPLKVKFARLIRVDRFRLVKNLNLTCQRCGVVLNPLGC